MNDRILQIPLETYQKDLEAHRKFGVAEGRVGVYKLQEALVNWLKAYDMTGPDNGPSLSEHDCAEKARELLKELGV